ncbi:putative polygalacturonase [Arabidopsis thaliana]
MVQMGLELLFSVILIASYHLQHGDAHVNLSIKDFLSDAKNTTAAHSQAFKEAWNALCEANVNGTTTSLVINANETYIVQPQLFQGPCASRNIHIQIDGKLEAPKMVREWGNYESKCWLCFTNVKGLVLNGSGILHPHGEAWWSSIEHSHRPRTIGFSGSSNILYNGLTQMNSPKNHISILDCTNVTLSNFHLIAPKDSPNTDGIDIAHSNNIRIFNSSIQTGDDCIAINGGSYDINITHVACGPGHGISIGSLGRYSVNDTVQNVKIRHCSFNGTENGARIKTWTGGLGVAKNILYENITLTDTKYPIIIDQHYCNGGHNCTKEAMTAVKVSNVTFRYFTGTCANDIAIKLDCDEVTGCKDIVMEHINITSSSTKRPLTAYCQFADIISHFVSMKIKCDYYEEPLVPVEPPQQVEPPTPTKPLAPAKPPRHVGPLMPTKPPTMFPKPLAPAKPPVYYAKPPAPYAQPSMLSFLSYLI